MSQTAQAAQGLLGCNQLLNGIYAMCMVGGAGWNCCAPIEIDKDGHENQNMLHCSAWCKGCRGKGPNQPQQMNLHAHVPMCLSHGRLRLPVGRDKLADMLVPVGRTVIVA